MSRPTRPIQLLTPSRRWMTTFWLVMILLWAWVVVTHAWNRDFDRDFWFSLVGVVIAPFALVGQRKKDHESRG